MKMKCEVIQDLLPLYCDHQASPESCRLIEEHLQECDSCRLLYEKLAEGEDTTQETVEENLAEMDPLKKIKNATRIRVIIAVLASIAVASLAFYFLFIEGQQVSSADMDIKTSAFMEKGDDGKDYYNVQFDFDLKNGKCIDVRGERDDDGDGSVITLSPYSQIKPPFDDRGQYPGRYTTGASQETPFTEGDILIVQFKDKTVEYHLKDIAEKGGIQ